MGSKIQRCQYRKLRDDGSWGLFGPASELVEGRVVSVRKADRSLKEERVGEVVSKPFFVDGVPHVYARIADRAVEPAAKENPISAATKRGVAWVAEMCAECGRFPGVRECHDSSGLAGLCCQGCARLPRHERSFA